MLPLEFVATPEASPRCMSGGSLMKFGTESKLSSGADVDCANADGLISTKSPAINRFMRTSLVAGPAVLWSDARNAPADGLSIQTGAIATQSLVGGREDRMLNRAAVLAALML